jgi:hypothetical protein
VFFSFRPGTVRKLSTCCPARGPSAMRYVHAVACNDANTLSTSMSAR